MTRRIVRTPLTEADIEDIAEYLRQEAGLAVTMRFVTNAEAAFRALAHTPRIGAVVGLSGLIEPDIRRWHIERFDRLIILERRRVRVMAWRFPYRVGRSCGNAILASGPARVYAPNGNFSPIPITSHFASSTGLRNPRFFVAPNGR